MKSFEMEALADSAGALAHSHRLQLLEHMKQQPQSVEDLAAKVGLTVANASRHLQILRRACLVNAKRRGKHVYYELCSFEEHSALVAALRAVRERQAATVSQLRTDFLREKELLEPISRNELIALLRAGAVTVIDVRPEAEYAGGHIAGAVNVPLGQLEAHLGTLKQNCEVVAYCRGPHCVLSFEAVAALQRLGFRARRLQEGPVEWAAAGLTVKAAA
ncbi:ArsR/SmtB family transcription factor [Achromobacter xylosoxidans]|uniref:ArsR/SmtB family transcription factor n=1 Tax=Alcaligenes xylosoxydans xylosoxydans TaxID=85698 RepID=UPI001F13C65B|nr:metalloregulator ArsR/SmtB family transcription factor [Achromobacter xylosoxidans]